MDDFSDMAPSSSQQQDSRFSSSTSPSMMAEAYGSSRPRRHLPSPALAQAKSFLKLNSQSYAHSFDVSELSGLRLSMSANMASSPSAPVVSSSSLLAGRRLPVPALSSGVTDAMDEMDALINRCSSAHQMGSSSSAAAGAKMSSLSSSSSSLSSRKLPAPPVSAAALAMNQSRRLLPRPLSCDVPCVSNVDLLSGLGGYLSSRNGSSGGGNGGGGSHLLFSAQRPYSFDYAPPDIELDGSALSDCYDGGGGSDPSLLMMMQDAGKGPRGLIRQSSTTSCPALVRPCVSPRSPKFRADGSFPTSPFGGSSSTASLSPHPPYLPADSNGAGGYLSAGGPLVPSMLTPAPPNALSPLPSLPSYLWPSSPNNETSNGSLAAMPVTIPSVGSAFRSPLLSHRQASLPAASALLRVDSVGSNSSSTSSSTSSSSSSSSSLTLRRLRYGQGSGALSSSLQPEYSIYRRQPLSRSRPAARSCFTTAAR